jgi:Ca-activated chloride channel homolog
VGELRAAILFGCLILLCVPACDRGASGDAAAGAFLEEQSEAGDDELWQVESAGDEEKSPSRKVQLDEGERVAFVEVDARAAFGGAIRAGDRVDFLATLRVPEPRLPGASRRARPADEVEADEDAQAAEPDPERSTKTLGVTILQNVSVVDASPAGDGRGAWVLSVAVTPKEARVLRMGGLHGELRTLLRRPDDEEIGSVKRQTLRGVFEDLDMLNRARVKRQDEADADATQRLEDTRLAGRVGKRMRALSLPADLAPAVVNGFEVGDRIDISLSVPLDGHDGHVDTRHDKFSGRSAYTDHLDMTFLQNVRVLEARAGSGQTSSNADAAEPVLVVEVSLDEAEALAVASGHGELAIVRRRSDDSEFGPIERMTSKRWLEDFEVINRARQKRTRRRARPRKKKSDPIQILRGSSGTSKPAKKSRAASGDSSRGGLGAAKAAGGLDGSNSAKPAASASANTAKPAAPKASSAPVTDERIVDAELEPRSTFALDVDTSSYTLARRHLLGGSLPPRSEVRVEEFINYFDYADAAPADEPFAVSVEGAPSPFRPSNRYQLLGIGVHAKKVTDEARKPINVTALVDTSSSMRGGDRIGMIQTALIELSRNLGPDDTIAIVGYGGEARAVLNRTEASDMPTIVHAVRSMEAKGNSYMEGGMRLAYKLAGYASDEASEDRVIIFSDGDPNIGADAHEELLESVASERAEGITLSTIGFGDGNYRDALMEQLADKGDGNSYFIDDNDEIERLFDERLLPTLVTVARDAKAQVEFDPDVVESYRRVGYDNRAMTDEQWYDPSADAGEVGAGHQVTVLYEVKLVEGASKDRLGTVRVRYKLPDGGSDEISADLARAAIHDSFSEASADLRFSASVAGFAEVLAETPLGGRLSLEHIAKAAEQAAGDDPKRAEFVQFIERAQKLRKRSLEDGTATR